MAPHAPTIASQGLTRTSGSGSTGRAPASSSRMKQSCRLANSFFAASSRLTSANRRHTASERSRTSGLVRLPNQPMNWVARRRGMRLVSRKLTSSCNATRARADRSSEKLTLEGADMNGDLASPVTWAAGAGALAYLFVKVKARLELSKAKHPSLRGHARLSRLVAKLVPFYDYDEERFFSSDDAPPEIVARRREGFWRLVKLYQDRFPETRRLTDEAASGISDLQFTSAYRVPFQYRTIVGRHLKSGSFYRASSGVTLTDADGNTLHDVSGSYGVNVLGNDFYKGCIERGAERVRDLGPVLGSYHPVVADNVERLRKISGLDEVSFHMSGTEAVMQAVRLARYHTRRPRLVRFCGAYHGWWGDVQPGVGNPTPARDTYTLKDMDEDALRVLRRRRDIACVLVNPLQALHPNASAPTDSVLLDSGRGAGFDRPAYTEWLRRLREVCSARGIVLIFDEVFVGFRLARGGA